MTRGIVGVVAGLATWFVVATLINVLFRISWRGYAEAEMPLTFTHGMLIGRLALGALSSLCSGLTVAWITRGFGMAAKVLSVLLLAVFIPVHYGLWDKFPVWYHLTFLASLIPFTLLGAMIKAHRTPKAPAG